ncbi:uncharacterized protein MAM_00978 [Metarhizium album ARSEF 1941]|uniref:Uncharacterized protein n=1 Tax=Metarhizium album (strain ARSEF 1941) TaxID=1081103 RepID=A0A0B2X0A8_METAS|nr:uncharacterized protein MAM_00978 [Metarhizium album ARSEF 1941]KHO01977.1 hypothetical protein MAM_00978 [Metarhizium album ARSEF 1941]
MLTSVPHERATKRRCGVSVHKTHIIRCKISHRRLFPEKHRFAYPYLSVGIPVRSPTSNWLLSVDAAPWWERGWLHVSPKDHLNRGRDGATLSENIDAYLKLQQGLNPADFPHVYLLTSPRFLNYTFNPASFWYLYTSVMELKYVIAEVNNTFDERRMYLFPASGGPGIFRQRLDKDFHVSPFNSRKGTYTLSTLDPADGRDISVAITLRSSKGRPKMTARWWSDEPAIDPLTISTVQALWLLLCWGSRIFTTFPKILFHAILLAQLHRLHIWYRPEPRQSALPRRATATESFVQSIFVQYVEYLVNTAHDEQGTSARSPSQVSVEEACPDSYSLLGLRITQQPTQDVISLRIHTPQFYRQLITYEKLSDYLSYTLLDPYEENHTAWSNDAKGLIDTVRSCELAADKQLLRHGPHIQQRLLVKILLATSRRVRCVQPRQGCYPGGGLPSARGNASNVRSNSRASSSAQGRPRFLDEFVGDNYGPWLQVQYVLATVSLEWRAWAMSLIGGE